MLAPPGTTANHRVPPGEAGGVCGGAVNGELTPGITPPPPAIAPPPEGASVPPPPAKAPPPPAPAAPTAPVPPVAAAIVVPASAYDAAPRPQAMAAPMGLYSPIKILRAVMGMVAIKRAKMMLARLRSRVDSTP